MINVCILLKGLMLIAQVFFDKNESNRYMKWIIFQKTQILLKYAYVSENHGMQLLFLFFIWIAKCVDIKLLY